MILRASSVEKRRACRRSCPSARVVRAVSATAISNCPRAKRGRNSSCPWAFSIIDALDTTRARAPWEENRSPSPRYGARSARENLDRVAQNDAKYPVARLIYASVGAQSHRKVAPQRVNFSRSGSFGGPRVAGKSVEPARKAAGRRPETPPASRASRDSVPAGVGRLRRPPRLRRE